jgi:copper(I)-binding protein
MAGVLTGRRSVALLAVAGLSAVLPACGSARAASSPAAPAKAAPANAAPVAGPIRVVDARCPLPASADVGVVYFTVENNGGTADRLVSATTVVAQQAAVHREVRKGLVITMEPSGPVTVPAHGSLVLSVGGTHLMLVGLARPFRVGDHFGLTLHFQHAGDVAVTVPVVPAAS